MSLQPEPNATVPQFRLEQEELGRQHPIFVFKAPYRRAFPSSGVTVAMIDVENASQQTSKRRRKQR